MNLAAVDLQLKCALRARGCTEDFVSSITQREGELAGRAKRSRGHLEQGVRQMDPAPRRNSRRKEKVEAGCASIAVAARSKSSPEIVKVSSFMFNNVAKKTYMT